jgi:hypothetical protein
MTIAWSAIYRVHPIISSDLGGGGPSPLWLMPMTSFRSTAHVQPSLRVRLVPLRPLPRDIWEIVILINVLHERDGGSGMPWGSMRGGPVTKIVDGRRVVVSAVAAGYRASPGDSAPSCGTHPSRGARRLLPGTSDSAPTPCRVFQFQTSCSF